MNNRHKYQIICGALIIVATLFRLPQLSKRPMHTDEAVHAFKFINMLNGEYRYDPNEYHGPVLNIATLPMALIRGERTLPDLTIPTLRLIPVLFSLLTLIFVLSMRQTIGEKSALYSGFLLALSPVLIFYSRYYIQETLLVCFTSGLLFAGFRYIQNPSLIWSFILGLFAGLMHTAKETWILTLIALIGAGILIRIFYHVTIKGFTKFHLLTAIISMFFISALLYSNFLTSPQGILNSWSTYSIYLTRGLEHSIHRHSFTYYFNLLLGYQSESGPLYTEIFIVILAITGIVSSFKSKESWINPMRFLVFYTVILTLIYSLIPYKTPWSLLSFWLGWILLAGYGTYVLLQHINQPYLRKLIFLMLLIGIIHLSNQSFLLNYIYASSPDNPWTYAHPDESIFKIRDELFQIAAKHPHGFKIPIHVIYPEHDYWPLPWLLRNFTNTGWYQHIEPNCTLAPVILISPSMEPELILKLYDQPPPGERHLYIPMFHTSQVLRPGALINGYCRQDWIE